MGLGTGEFGVSLQDEGEASTERLVEMGAGIGFWMWATNLRTEHDRIMGFQRHEQQYVCPEEGYRSIKYNGVMSKFVL